MTRRLLDPPAGAGRGARLGIGGKSAHPNPNRGAVMHCPYCGGEDLWPDYETDYAWRCTECCRVFTVKLHGHVDRAVAASPLADADADAKGAKGEGR